MFSKNSKIRQYFKLLKKSPNQVTIEAYNNEVTSYIRKTPPAYKDHHKPMLRWIDSALSHLNGKDVLELGSATPRDATYMRNKGFNVQTSDASKKFVQNLQRKGEDTIQLNALTDNIPTGYDLIFANAVAPHFTYDDTVQFLNNVSQSLSSGSRLAFNLKIGTGESWINEKFAAKRFIHYWQPEDIKELLAQYAFNIVFLESNVDGDLPNHHWINIVVEKR